MPVLANAEEIDGLYYDFVGEEATLTAAPGYNPYSGEIIIPDYVNYHGRTYPVVGIKDYAFGWCFDLTSVTIGNNVSNIGGHAFYGCSSLTKLILPNSVEDIGGFAFAGCSNLKTMIIGNGLTYIWTQAFVGCNKLKKFYCLAKKVPEIRWSDVHNAFSDFPIEKATLYVPEESLWLYKSDSDWNDFGTIVGIKADGIEDLMGVNPVFTNEVKDASRFTLEGKHIYEPHKGINIIRKSNGRIKKAIVK